MRKTSVVLGFALAAALAVACSSSSGPTTYSILGNCTFAGLPIENPIPVTGPCSLGPAGQFTLNASIGIQLGAQGQVPVDFAADWTQGTSVLHSQFAGYAVVPPLSELANGVPLVGGFVYDGGTGPFAQAIGAALVDGGVSFSADGKSATAQLSLTGALSY